MNFSFDVEVLQMVAETFRPVVVDEASERVSVRRMLTLSLTFDHRLVDGAPAARFLQTVKHLVERPTRWLFR